MEIFKEIEIGDRSLEQLNRSLAEHRIQFNDYAVALMQHSDFTPDVLGSRVSLIKISLSELGLHDPISYDSIIRTAAGAGLELCPLYLAAFLRLQYLEQPEGPYLTVCSPRPEADTSFPTGFYLRRKDGHLWLRGYRVEGEAEWPVDNEFVFLK